MNSPSVLSFGHDLNLLLTRRWMLERLPCSVTTVVSLADFREQVCKASVDLILICQTVQRDECESAYTFAAEHAAHARVMLLFHDAPPYSPTGEHVEWSVRGGPADFLSVITRMLSRPADIRPSLPVIA